MKSLTGPIVKSVIFIVVTALATTLLALTITNGSSSGSRSLSAIFTDVTSLNTGDDVRMAGVRIGQVDSIAIYDRTEAKVSMTLDTSVPLAKTLTATIRYRNLIGQRYIELDQGSGSTSDPLANGSTLAIDRTQPAVDLTALFNGFQPLFQVLDPTQVNELAYEIIQVFQGEGPTVTDLLARTGSLTQTLAQKDEVIKSVIGNLNSVLSTVYQQRKGFSTLITTLATLVSGLAGDREAIGSAISGIAGLTSSVSSLLQQGRAPLKESIDNLGNLAGNLAASSGELNSFLQTLPGKLNTITRTLDYGSWVNTYICSISGDIPVPSGTTTFLPGAGGTGVANPAARCKG